MIRLTVIASLTVLLALVLYLPSAHPPRRFIEQLRSEHVRTAEFWSPTRAERILARTLDAQASTDPRLPIPDMRAAPGTGATHTAVASEMSAVNARLFNSPYFRSVDALLLLASYRYFVMLEWLPWLAPFGMAATIDALAIRTVKAKQFAHHDPEAFAASIAAAVALACAALVACVLPATLPPWLPVAMPVALMVLLAAALRNFHRRG